MTHMTESLVLTPEIVQLEPRHAAVLHVRGATTDLPSLLSEAFDASLRQIAASGGEVAGPPFARYLAFGERVEAEVGFPYVGTLLASDSVHDTLLPDGRAVVGTYVGGYDEIGAAWKRVADWITEQRLKPAGAPWESYLTAPDAPGEPVTQIVFPIR
jgi:effector-binding domain-containing protein